MDKKIKKIVDRALNLDRLNEDDLRNLLLVDTGSEESYYMSFAARKLSSSFSKNIAEVHGQIGIDASPCPIDCSFCSFAPKNKIFNKTIEFDEDYILAGVNKMIEEGANAIYLMATENYKFEKFIEISKYIKNHMLKDLPLLANIGDFSIEQAKILKDVGYVSIYHAIRMGEGLETPIPIKKRLKSIKAAKEVGLSVAMGVEPIGPEHTLDEIIEKTKLVRDYADTYTGAMRRTYIPGAPYPTSDEIPYIKMANIVSAIALYTGNVIKGISSHEPNFLGIQSGVNIYCGEVGTNPRDTKEETVRGWPVKRVRNLFKEAGYHLLDGPSKILLKEL